MSDSRHKCQYCGTIASEPSIYCSQCGQLLMDIFESASPDVLHLLRRTGDIGVDNSTTRMEGYGPLESGGQPLISRVGDIGLDRSHNEIHIQNVQGSRAFYFSAKDTISRPVYPVRSEELNYPIHAGAGCHFQDVLLGLSTLHADKGVRFDRLVCILGHAVFKDGCQFGGDVVCPAEAYLESAEIGGSMLAGTLRLSQSIVVHGDLICDSLDAVSDYEIPGGTNITGAIRVRSKHIVRVGRAGNGQTTRIGALCTAGDVHIAGPVDVGLIQAGGQVFIHGPARFDKVIAAGVHLEGSDIFGGIVVSSAGLEIAGTVKLAETAVQGDIRVDGDLSLGISGMYLAAGQLRVDGKFKLANSPVPANNVFSLDNDSKVVPATENNPARLVSFHMTHELATAIHSSTGAQLTIQV